MTQKVVLLEPFADWFELKCHEACFLFIEIYIKKTIKLKEIIVWEI